MMQKRMLWIACLCACLCGVQAQERLYPSAFPLGEVRLLDGPFKQACSLNVDVLLQYDVDRLLAPFLKEAGLPPKAEPFSNWKGLDGHVGGHYLSALAIHYAATGNAECKRRMDYMVRELKRCQEAQGDGYLGGVPDGKEGCWGEIRKGNVSAIWNFWVPWYNLHKIYAGLRDACVYGGNEEAHRLFLRLCDWGLTVIRPLTDAQMEQMLESEFGGMNEVYADAYAMTGNLEYLDAAKRFSHRWLLDSMAAHVDNLDNKHANTQVPKAVGYLRMAELCRQAGREEDAALYQDAAAFFWETVVENRTLAFGGNSRREHFVPAGECISYVEEREGPESCNTYNMLKLSEGLFRLSKDARYFDYAERALFNHILSTQHPVHGGYVYFTPARPAHYRVYSSPNSAMWCCVGTGMENHGKYGDFIYSHFNDSLYVHLFAASRLEWEEQGITLLQETSFPDEEKSRLSVRARRPVRMKLMIRRPGWCEGMKAVCDGVDYAVEAAPGSYVCIDRTWRDGDVVELSLPMQVSIEELPHVDDYVAILRGPVLLGARMGEKDLYGLVADDGRWSHVAYGPLVSVFDTPILIGSRASILSKLQAMQPVAGKPFCYTVPGLFEGKYEDLQLEPFFRIHDCRYMIYWLSMTEREYAGFLKAHQEEEQRRLALDRRTADRVTPAEQQPETDHRMEAQHSRSGYSHGAPWREARDGGYFSYSLSTGGQSSLHLWVRYWGDEAGCRAFTIWVDGEMLARENLSGQWKKAEFVDVEYPVPEKMLEGKSTVTVTFRPEPGNVAGPVFGVRLVQPE